MEDDGGTANGGVYLDMSDNTLTMNVLEQTRELGLLRIVAMTKRQVRRTISSGTDDMPEYSPDGTRIAFHSDRSGRNEVYTMTSTGAAQTAITNHEATSHTAAWQADSTPPETTIDSGPAQGSTISDITPTFTFSSDEAGSTFECSLDFGGAAGFYLQFVQSPGSVSIFYDTGQGQAWQRIIPVTNRPHLPSHVRQWWGDSRGRWEGDTLVVDTSNLTDRTWFDVVGDFHTEQLHVVERFTMIDRDTILYEATMEDPTVFTRPWTISMPIYRVKDMDRLLEYQCVAESEEADGTFHRDPRTWYPR